MMRALQRTIAAGLLLLTAAGSATAHTGSVAIAVPLADIRLDGDLSDWPADMVRYPVARPEWGIPLTGPEDFSASFRIGYDPGQQALYVAVEVTDEAAVVIPSDNRVNQDGCQLFIDLPHQPGTAPTAQYHLNGVTPVTAGLARAADMQVESAWGEETRQYEWRIAMDPSAPQQLQPGAVLGFDLALYDWDAEDTHTATLMAWGKGADKEIHSDMLGDLLLVDENWRPGRLQGHLRWADQPTGAARARVHLHSVESPDAWLALETDPQGLFSVAVPAGAYRVEPLLGRGPKAAAPVQVKAGETTVVDLQASLPTGRQIPAIPGSTVPAGPGLRQGAWRTWGSADGMPLATVGAMLQDRQGRMWFGTGTFLGGRGLARYDGAEVVHFSTADGLPDDDIRALVEDRQGHIWIATMNGVARYDGSHFTLFTDQDGLLHNNVLTALADSLGNLWFGTGLGLSRYDGQRFVNITVNDGLASSQVHAMTQDRAGRLWLGSWSGVNRYDGQSLTAYGHEAGWQYSQPNDIVEDRDGILWFGSRSGLIRFDGQTFAKVDSVTGGSVNALAIDHDGYLWLGLWGEGVVRFKDRQLNRYTVEDGLANAQIWSLLVDREGRLWAGVMGGNISRYDKGYLRNFTTQDGLKHNLVKAVGQDDQGAMWFGTIRGVSHFDGEDWTTYTEKAGFEGTYIWSGWADRAGRIWLGEQGSGVYRRDGDQWTRFTVQDGLAGGIVLATYQDRDGHMWFGTTLGVSRFDGENWTSFRTDDGLASNHVNAVWQDRAGHWWFGTPGGVSRYDGQGFVSFTAADGFLQDNQVLSIAEDRAGHLWFGTWGGLSRYDGQQWTTWGIGDGLSHDRITALLADQDGTLWIGTWGGGITRYDGTVFQRVLKQDGLGSELVQRLYQDRDGQIWIATEGGVARYRRFPTPPTVRLVSLLADKRYDPIETVRFASSQELVIFEFQGASLQTLSERLTYLYRLQGHHADWRQTSARQVEYSNLPVGSYTFQVKAVDRDLNYSQTAQVHFEVHPPYQRYGLFAALAGVGLLALWQSRRLLRRDQQLRTANRDLRQTNQDLQQATQAKSRFLASMSHEIRTPMNAILGYAQILQRRPNLDTGLRPAIDTIHKSGQHLLGLINEVLDIAKIEAGRMDLAAEPFDLAELLEGLAASFQPQCDAKALQWQLEIGDLAGLRVQGDSTKLRQVLTNLVGNAVKFTDQGRVVLRLDRQGEETYRFSVSDTGPGMDAEEQANLFEEFRQGAAGQRSGGTGLGLPLAQRYVALMGGQVEVVSTPGQGSTFAFALALPTAGAQDTQHADQIVKALAPGQTVQILIADDVAENRAVLQQLLQELGAQVAVVENGQQALDHLADQRPDILFLDIRMPVLDGIETIHRIRAQSEWTDLPVVAISASTLDHQRQAVLDHGFNAFVGKPFRFDQVCEQLEKLLGVSFEYEEEAAAPTPVTQDWSDVEVPADLLDRLKEAVEFRQVTHMEQGFQELEQLGHRPAELAEQLRRLRQGHQMDAIVPILQTLKPRE